LAAPAASWAQAASAEGVVFSISAAPLDEALGQFGGLIDAAGPQAPDIQFLKTDDVGIFIGNDIGNARDA